MRENRDFVVPVNILTPLRAPRFLGPHDTLPCVLMTTIMMLRLSYAQPYINDSTKPGEVAVTMIGNTNSTVYSSNLCRFKL